MKLLIFGATGGTGRELVRQALEQGHLVTAFVRDTSKYGIGDNSLRIVKGDIIDYESVINAVKGQDIVISALGVNLMGKNTILSSGTKNIINAMEEHDVRRFICVTSLGVGNSKGQLGWRYNFILKPFILRNIFADKERQEKFIKDSLLDWIIVRPAQLTNGPLTGKYHTWTGKPTGEMENKISRADVAHFILTQLVDDTYLRDSPALSY
jgi:putative NADH-flavin reductase